VSPNRKLLGCFIRQVYANEWRAKNIQELKQLIKLCLKKIDENLIKSLMDSVLVKLNYISKKGVLENQ
jgi:hypothetical protein